jgi:hypothetical protein
MVRRLRASDEKIITLVTINLLTIGVIGYADRNPDLRPPGLF